MLNCIPSGKLTWQWKMDLLKMYSLLKMGIFHCHVSLLEGISEGFRVAVDFGWLQLVVSCFHLVACSSLELRETAKT